MTSIYRRALGGDYDRLHPEMRERLAFDADDPVVLVARGRMTRVRSNPLARPVLSLLATRDLPFPETGRDVPFTVRTYAFEDADGRETLVLRRAFDVGRTRRFDARMTYDGARGCLLDAIGRDGRLVTALDAGVDDAGELRLDGRRQALQAGGQSVTLPVPLRADVAVREGYDEAAERFTVDVAVTNRLLGFVFGYDGWFTLDREPCESVPAAVRQIGLRG